MLGEGSGPTAGDTLRLLLGGGVPALVLTLGLVPATALVLAAASRSERLSPRARRVLVGVVAGGVVLLVVGVLAVTSDPTGVRLAMESWFFAVGSPRTLAGVWLAIVAVGVSTAAVGVLLRRRGAVVSGAGLVAVGALASALAAGASMGWSAWTSRHYRGGLPLLAAVLADGKVALALVATTASLVAVWCTVVAWRRLAALGAPAGRRESRGAGGARPTTAARRRRDGRCGRGGPRRHGRGAGGVARAGARRRGGPGARGVRGALARRGPGPRAGTGAVRRGVRPRLPVVRRGRPDHVARRDRAARLPPARST